MIWLLYPNKNNICFKQYFNSEPEKYENYIVHQHNVLDSDIKNYKKINVTICQLDNVISYEVNNTIYCYQYTEKYNDSYIEYEYTKIDKHNMPNLKDNSYYYYQKDQLVYYEIKDNKLHIYTNNLYFFIM